MPEQQPAPQIRVLGGNPSDEDVAAVTAVLAAALDELAGESRRRGDEGPTGWQVSQRAIRAPLPFGAWRDFRA
ncbi:acyl-CoA carboxylase epsilon subunit [Pseudolysinimonas sp.]|jgi:hypothetical protein|uniref:acyl-CoA carboxylase epsilon subunit n=1 Tax=Pseudolysinimonas sp. TaxID=2680009 RepID=UPI003784FDA5